MPEVRAQIIVSAKDDASANLKKIGDTGAKLGTDLKQGLAGGIQAATGLNLASLSLVGGLTALGAGLKYAVDQAAEAEKIMAQTEAVVKSTGGAAGLTAGQIADLSGRLSQLNAIDDETIQGGANLLLTFKSVKSDAFEPAMQAAIDMSTAMGTDLKGSIIQVGKALEDPIRGLTALRRSGVSFTEEQQKVIKSLVETGRAAEAQQLILAELNTQFGGSGAAAAETYAGQLELLKINSDNLAQSLGEKLLPPLTQVLVALNEGANRNTLFDEALKRGVITQQEFNDMLMATRYNAKLASQFQEELTTKIEAQDAAVTAGRTHWEELAAAMGIGNQTVEDGKAHWLAMAAAMGIGEHAVLDYAAAARQLEAANKALEAGLAGDLTKAQADYQAVLAETNPEIERLTAEIDRYQRMQGMTWTVTTEATASVEEYELAQIHAAEAAQELAEFTGDNREEYLKLKIAADNAAEKVGALGEQMGISQTFTADYTAKLAENREELEALRGKQEEAAEALKRTTSEFVYNQLAAGLNTEQQQKLANELGLLDDASYLAASALQTLALAQAAGKLSAEGYYKSALDLRDTINSLQSRNIEINISTFYHEYRIQSGAAPGDHEGDYGAPGESGYVPPVVTTPTTPSIPPGHQEIGGPGGNNQIADTLARLPNEMARALSSALAQSGRL